MCNSSINIWKFKIGHVVFWITFRGTTSFPKWVPNIAMLAEKDWVTESSNPCGPKVQYLWWCHNPKIRILSLHVNEKIRKNQYFISGHPPCKCQSFILGLSPKVQSRPYLVWNTFFLDFLLWNRKKAWKLSNLIFLRICKVFFASMAPQF